jgi:hypothetical protein
MKIRIPCWFDGGAPATGLIKTEVSAVHSFGKGGGSSWSIWGREVPNRL